MININAHASSSEGNLFLIDDGKTKIMIECGLPIKKIREKLEFKMHAISACLISHAH